MKITRIDEAFSDNGVFGYKLRIKCDCGKIFETIYLREIILKPVCAIKNTVEYQYCPYCARKIDLSGVERV